MIDDRNNQPVSSHRISITVALDRRIGKIVTSKRVERIVYNRKTGGRRRKKGVDDVRVRNTRMVHVLEGLKVKKKKKKP